MGKRQFLKNFSEEDQRFLVGFAAQLLTRAGAQRPRAFRAGSFGFNADTLGALESNGLVVDASYNATLHGPESGVSPGTMLIDSCRIGQIYELPMTVFMDGTRRMRHLQLTACSWQEMEQVLWGALHAGLRSVVILWHGSELLDRSRKMPNPFVVARFRKLCEFLGRHRESFKVRNLDEWTPRDGAASTAPIAVGPWPTAIRLYEQVLGRAMTRSA